MIAVIAKHESASLLRSVSLWVLGGVIALLAALLFLQQVEAYLSIQPKLALQDHPLGLSAYMASNYFAPLALLFLVLGPLLAMRSFSHEFRRETSALWQSAPVSSTSIVLGKFLGISAVLIFWILVAILMLVSMQFFVDLDWGLVLSGTVGLVLCAMACASVGLFFSSLTRQPIVAAIASFALLLLLWLLGQVSVTGLGALKSLSLATHLNSFFNGYLSSADTIYLVLLAALFITLTIIRLDSLRHTGR